MEQSCNALTFSLCFLIGRRGQVDEEPVGPWDERADGPSNIQRHA